MRILALDMATRTGWAVHDEGRLVRSGMVKLPDRPGARVRGFEDWLRDQLDGVDVVAYESPALVRGRAAAHRVGCHLEAVVYATCGGQILYSTPAPQWKKLAGLKGNARKGEVLEWARRRWGLPDLVSHDEADALGVLQAALIAVADVQAEVGE